jgi:hypothetical protein
MIVEKKAIHKKTRQHVAVKVRTPSPGHHKKTTLQEDKAQDNEKAKTMIEDHHKTRQEDKRKRHV